MKLNLSSSPIIAVVVVASLAAGTALVAGYVDKPDGTAQAVDSKCGDCARLDSETCCKVTGACAAHEGCSGPCVAGLACASDCAKTGCDAQAPACAGQTQAAPCSAAGCGMTGGTSCPAGGCGATQGDALPASGCPALSISPCTAGGCTQGN